MSDGLHFARLATLVGKRHGVRWGKRRASISAVGTKDGSRFVMAWLTDGTLVLGEPQDFTVPERKKR